MTQLLTFAVDDTNDLFLDSSGNIAMTVDLPATLQACEQVVKTRLGEVVFDTATGIPYFETVFVGTPNLQIFNAAIKLAIQEVFGVTQVLSLTTEIVNQRVFYTATIETIYGTGTITNA